MNMQRAVQCWQCMVYMYAMEGEECHGSHTLVDNMASVSGTKRMLIKSDSIFCRNNCLPQYSSTMAWCCSNFRCLCPRDHTTSLGFPEDCRLCRLQWTPTDNVLRSTYNCHSCHYVHEMNTTLIAAVIWSHSDSLVHVICGIYIYC